ncbi:NUDIX hydrolase [Rhizohabitans arisaemae]|uniref:NUDIX hydrolase n=1 Tax=Rhizohabitans arisaemae TaxID=2720610 RepID=UPI0024B21EB9|nr:NUDIX domain-containing protein [Rhizohabitans arisaemae]
MGRRIDFYDDPVAPRPNSLVPSVNVVVTNEAGEILMIRRNGNWAIPGSAIDLGEPLPEAAIRETLEETGVRCEITGLTGTYTDPKHVILYISDGEARQEFSIVLADQRRPRTHDDQANRQTIKGRNRLRTGNLCLPSPVLASVCLRWGSGPVE